MEFINYYLVKKYTSINKTGNKYTNAFILIIDNNNVIVNIIFVMCFGIIIKCRAIKNKNNNNIIYLPNKQTFTLFPS